MISSAFGKKVHKLGDRGRALALIPTDVSKLISQKTLQVFEIG
jgi:hypothetical protein